ncbi:MAG: restriction endonuclease subunit S [Candidatus Levyibacteriota bacterium]
MNNLVNLADVCEFLDFKRRPITSRDRVLGPYPYYGANGIQGYVDKYIFDEELVLLAEDGGHFDEPSRGVAYRVSGKCWVNNHAHVLKPKRNIDVDYLGYSLKQYDVRPFITGAIIKKLTQKDAKRITFYLPSLEEQQRIVKSLDHTDSLLKKRKHIIKLLDDYIDSVFFSMFVENADKKNIPLVKLKDLTTKITDGVHFKPVYTETGIPFISVKNVTSKKLNFYGCKFVSIEDHHKFIVRCKPELGDILYTKVGATYGRACIVDDEREFSLYVSVSLIKPVQKLVNPSYLKAVLNSSFVKRQADRSVKGAGVPDLHLIEIKNFDIPLPNTEDQNKFTTIIQKVEELKQKMFTQSVEFEKQYQSLMQKSFRLF